MALIYTHLWSLSVEETFYLLWPCVLVLGFRYRGTIAAIAVVAAALFRIGALHYLNGKYLHSSFPGVMDSIAVGCLLAIYQSSVRKFCRWIVQSTIMFIVLLFTTWMTTWLLWRGTWFPPIRTSDTTALWGLIPVLIALCVHVAVERRDWVLNNMAIQSVGVLSYSLYLWQQPAALASKGLGTLVSLVLLVGMALLSYFCIERPALRFKKGRIFRGASGLLKGPALAGR
jgi:peptidoglycan/LPS O-acetylase OafA/YrhL